ELGRGSDFIDIINYCEVAEYLIAFDVGRRYQNLTNTLFTLSGAFSAFRRRTILQSHLYQERTVSEDTDLTFNIRKAATGGRGRVGYIKNATAYVEPIESLTRLYSQRVRWQRGEIEVMSSYYCKVPSAAKALFEYWGRILISDHTLAFSRLTWTFLLPFLYFLGYPLATVMVGMIGLFFIYFLIDALYFALAYRSVDEGYQKELKKVWWVVFFLPFYRYLSYWFRLAGIIIEMTESRSWRTESPVKQLVDMIRGLKPGWPRGLSFNKGGRSIEG
ncbi:MAG: hypothetical protein QHH02_01660, partial [Syntrophomonadaceae bacterium]|nr:hypothetical protein [Syntrophomonadaceae bacterium]